MGMGQQLGNTMNDAAHNAGRHLSAKIGPITEFAGNLPGPAGMVAKVAAGALEGQIKVMMDKIVTEVLNKGDFQTKMVELFKDNRTFFDTVTTQYVQHNIHKAIEEVKATGEYQQLMGLKEQYLQQQQNKKGVIDPHLASAATILDAITTKLDAFKSALLFKMNPSTKKGGGKRKTPGAKTRGRARVRQRTHKRPAKFRRVT